VDSATLAKLLIVGGLVLVVVGLLVFGLARAGWDHVPGDSAVEIGGVRINFLLGLSILLSVVGTIALNLFFRR
jgi:hypothetical protein